MPTKDILNYTCFIVEYEKSIYSHLGVYLSLNTLYKLTSVYLWEKAKNILIKVKYVTKQP